MKLPLDCPELANVETTPVASIEAQSQVDRAYGDLQTARLTNLQAYCDTQAKRIADLEHAIHQMMYYYLTAQGPRAWEIGNQALTSL